MRELGRRANVSITTISKVMEGSRLPSFEFCSAIAGPLGVSEIEVFRIAGLIKRPPQKDMTYQELVEILEDLTEEERLEVVKYAKYLLRGG